METVRTRFAPSPTGYLHIGGVRTALFNWLFARRHQGSFILRIDDTDARRNVDEALAPILHGFRWLGIDWDEGPEVGGVHGPYYQSLRQERYRSAAAALVENGSAYWDYATADELQAERAEAETAKRRFIYSRRWMAHSLDDRRRFEAEGRRSVVRLRMPRDGVCRIADLIRGDVAFEWTQEQDHVIQRTDGSCLYHLASVVDDHAMRISHVIRAEEHLSNTPRQLFIARSLGFDPPRFAHLPFVAEPGSRNKLSKRKLDKYMKHPDFAQMNEHGRVIADVLGLTITADTFNPVVLDFYEQVGYLPEALLNYLLLLGWSLDDRTETFDRGRMIDSFSLERVNKAPASFDPKKLDAFQSRYMQGLRPERRVQWMLPYLQRAGWIDAPPDDQELERVARIVEAAGERLRVAGDILGYPEFFVDDERLQYDAKAVEKRILRAEGATELLAEFRTRLAENDDWSGGALEQLMARFVEERGIRIGQIIHSVRVAVTGKPVGFGLFETLSILGRARTLARIDRLLRGV